MLEEEPVAKVLPKYHFKGIKKFDKNLTSKKLMLADLLEDKEDPDYKEKVAKCF